jgi:hypothetical protein
MNKVFKHGLKIDKTLDRNLGIDIDRVNLNKASLTILDGGVGEGKTTSGTILAQRYAYKLGEEFSIVEQVRMGGSDFLKGLQWCIKNKRRVILYDEAGDFNTRASLTYFNQTINRIFETYRALKIIVILCLPSFSDIDTSLMKKGIARKLIHCYGRTANYGNYSVYSLYRMFYLKKRLEKCIVPNDMYSRVTPNFRGHFLDLDTEDSDTLTKLSMKGKKDIIKKSMLKDRNLISIKEIAEKTGYSLESIRRYIKIKKISGEKEGATLYFNSSIVQNILNQKATSGRVAL